MGKGPNPDVMYVIEDSKGNLSWGYTPDGEGFYFYDSQEEFEAQHGDELPEEWLTDEEFEDLRYGEVYAMLDKYEYLDLNDEDRSNLYSDEIF